MNRIREIRKRLKIKQADVAAKAGISQPYLCDLEYNRRDGTPETLIGLPKYWAWMSRSW